MNGMKITSGAMWALLGMLLAGMFVTHKIHGMLAFAPASQTAVTHQRTAANNIGDVSELAAPASCDPYVASSSRIRLARETPIAMVLQAAHEGLTATQADNYLNARRSASTGAALLPPPPVVTGQTWATTNSDGLDATWHRPTRELGGHPVRFLGLDEAVRANPGRISIRRHDGFIVDLPTGTLKPVNNGWTTWSLRPLLGLARHPRPADTDRYFVDVTTGGSVSTEHDYPVQSGDVELPRLFNTTAPTLQAIPGMSVVSRTVTWKIYAMAGNIVIPRVGYHRPIQRSCEVISRVNSTIASEDRAAIAGLISELDGVDSDPAAPSDLQAMVAVAKHNVTDALQRRLTPDQNAIDAANARADYYRSLYVAYWNFFEVRVPAQITELENVLIGGNGIVLLLALVFTLLALDMRRKLSKLPPAPPSTSVITEIQYAFLASMEAELFQLLSFVRANIAAGHEDYNWVHKDLTQGTLISALMEDPSRLLRLARLLAEAEIQRLGPRHTPAEPMPAAKAGLSIDSTFAKAIEELCLAITDAAGVARPTTKLDLVWLVARATGSMPHAIEKAGKAALAAHTCPKVESTTGSGEHRAGKYKGTDLAEALCRKIITFVGEKAEDGTPLVDLVNAATSALNKALKKAFDDGAASRDGAIKHYEEENRKAAALITALQEAYDILKEEFAAVFKSLFPGEELVYNSAGYVEKPFDASHRMEKALEALRTGTTGFVTLDVVISELRWLRDNNSKGPNQRMAHIKRALGEAMSVAEATGATREEQPQTRPLSAVYVEAATEASNPARVENDKDAADVIVAAKEIDLSNPGAVLTDEQPGNGRDRSGARLSQSSPTAPPTEASSSS